MTTYVRIRNLGRNDGSFTGRSHAVVRRRLDEPWTACGFGIGLAYGDTLEQEPSATVCANCARITGGR